MIKDYLDKKNLHHAYLIEGKKEEIIPDLLDFIKSIGVEIKNNPDFNFMTLDSFKIENARNLKSQSMEMGTTSKKKIFVVAINNFLIEAQNTLLKIFEEPIENTIFFVIIPDTAVILPTLLSRFYLIKVKNDLKNELKQAKDFIAMSSQNRILFIKELLKGDKGSSSEEENILQDSSKTRAIIFLNSLEVVLNEKIFKNHEETIKKIEESTSDVFYQIFKAREYLRQPGSSAKSLMEGVALVIPTKF